MSGQAGGLKYRHIARVLSREITDGLHPQAARLPGEHALATRFAVSRNTVRQALAELTERNLIQTHRGRGSFVTFDHEALDDRVGWSRALAARVPDLRTEILRMERVQDPELGRMAGAPGDAFVALDRIRVAPDGAVLSLERSRFPATGMLHGVPERGLVRGSLAATLREAGLVATSGDEWIEVVRLTAAEARLLRRSSRTRFLRSRRIAWDAAGRFVEHVESLLDPDRFQLQLHFDGAAR